MIVQSEIAIVTDRFDSRNAGINLGRFIQTIQCPEDFTYCFLGSAMLVVAEMSTGILVACVPTLGPIFFSNRFRANIKARYQFSHLRKNRRTALRNGSTVLTTLGDPASDVFDERPSTTLDEPEVELQDSLKMGNRC